MKIRVDLSELLDSTLNGHITFRNHNTEVIKGWIKKIYGIDKDNEIVINRVMTGAGKIQGIPLLPCEIPSCGVLVLVRMTGHQWKYENE